MIELLVVVAIIAVLISILVPSLNRARESARQIKCLANQHQIHLGFMVFAADHDDYPPGAGGAWGQTANWGCGAGQYFQYADGEPYAESLLITRGYAASTEGFVCPELANLQMFRTLAWPASMVWGAPAGTHYGFNTNLVGRDFRQPEGTARFYWNWGYEKPARPLSRFKRPSSVVVLADWVSHWDHFFNDPVWGMGAPMIPDIEIAGPYNSVRVMAVHGNRRMAGVTHLDGHGVMQPLWFGSPPDQGNPTPSDFTGAAPDEGNGVSFCDDP